MAHRRYPAGAVGIRAVVLALAALAAVPGVARAAPELLDRIVAVVDDQIVLWSELELRTLLEVQQQGRNPAYLSDRELAGERRRVLADMIDELVVVEKAEKDSLEADPARVEELLGSEFSRLKQRVSADELTSMLERSNMSERQLKARYRKQIQQQLLYEQMLAQLASRQFITRRDVDEFRQTYGGTLPPKLSISHINLKVTPADSIKAGARARIERAGERLAAGESFADVAREVSEDPGTAADGGTLGCFSPGSLAPEFERVAADLRPGETSAPVLTPFGYHLIRLDERRESQLCASHILARAGTTAADRDRIRVELEALRQQALAGEDFAQLARDRSEDVGTARQGGLWQVLDRTALPPFLEPIVAELALGAVSEPFFLEDGGHILKINDDNATLEALVRELRVRERMDQVIAEYRQQIHVEERLEDEWLWDPHEAAAEPGGGTAPAGRPAVVTGR